MRRRLQSDARSPAVLLFFLIAAVGTWLVLPRATLAPWVVLPRLDRAALARLDTLEEERATAALAQGLSHQARTVGELFRRVGQAAARGDGAQHLLSELRLETARLLASEKQLELLHLRALQERLFVTALLANGGSRESELELLELGGTFLAETRGRFSTPRGALALSPGELRLLFRHRWGRLTGTHRAPGFGPSLEEWRAYSGLLLRFPQAPVEDARGRGLERARVAAALGQLDDRFPTAAAVGLFLAQAGEWASSATQLQSYLDTQPSGPYALSVRNALVFVRSQQ